MTTPYVAAAARPTPPCASRARRSPCPTGRSSSPTPRNHQVVHLEEPTSRPSAAAGAARAQFNEPQGVLLATPEIAERLGCDLLVADSVNHQVKGIRFSDGSIHVVAGTGAQLRERTGGGPALEQALSTPWDLAWLGDRVVIAMAGTHQLWALDTRRHPRAGPGRGRRRHVERGPRRRPGPRGLVRPAVRARAVGRRATASGSPTRRRPRLRSVTSTPMASSSSRPHVGTGLFDFGHRDGAAAEALLQHPLGVTELPDGSVAVSDTYNGAVRRFDPVDATR